MRLCMRGSVCTCAVPNLNVYVRTHSLQYIILYTLSKQFKIFHSHRTFHFPQYFSSFYCSNISQFMGNILESRSLLLFIAKHSIELNLNLCHLISFVSGINIWTIQWPNTISFELSMCSKWIWKFPHDQKKNQSLKNKNETKEKQIIKVTFHADELTESSSWSSAQFVSQTK